MNIIKYEDLSRADLELLNEAERARENAYNPYSKFYVGAALLARNGNIIGGANLENASYGITLCAERSAFARANATGIRVFNKIAIITRGDTFDVEEPTMPCGACRQWIYEFSQISGKDLEVISSNTKKTKILRANISELLLGAFGPKDLGIDVERFRDLRKTSGS